MPNGTDHQPPAEDPQPTGNRILDEPATVAACQADYAAAAAARLNSAQRDAHAQGGAR